MPEGTRKDYDKSDVEVVLSRGDWKNWGEVLNWLKREGEGDNELTASEVQSLIEDVEAVQKAGGQYISDANRAYEELRHHRQRHEEAA